MSETTDRDFSRKGHEHEGAASRALLGKGSVYTLATAAQLAGAVLVQPALSRLLSRDDYGRVSLATIITSLLGLLFAVGLPAVITREYFRSGGERTARVISGMAAAIAIVAGGIALAAGPLWGIALDGFDLPLLLGTSTAITFSIITTGQALLRARNQAGRFVLIVVVNVVGGQLLGLAAISFLQPTGSRYLAGVAAGSLAGAVLSLCWARPALPTAAAKSSALGWFAIALPTVPHSLALYLMNAGDRFVIQAQRGAGQVAAYSLAYLIGSLGITLVAAANNAWAPLIYGAAEDRRWRVLSSTTRDMAQLAALLAGGLALAGPLALWIVADPHKYSVAHLTPVVALTALATVPYVLYLASAHVLFWSGKTISLLWITPVAAIANLVAVAVILPWGGLAGAALASAGAYALLALFIGGVRRKLAEVAWSGRGIALGISVAACVLGAVLPLNLYGDVARLVGVVILLGLAAKAARRLVASRR